MFQSSVFVVRSCDVMFLFIRRRRRAYGEYLPRRTPGQIFTEPEVNNCCVRQRRTHTNLVVLLKSVPRVLRISPAGIDRDATRFQGLAAILVPWVAEVFLVRFPVSVMSLL